MEILTEKFLEEKIEKMYGYKTTIWNEVEITHYVSTTNNEDIYFTGYYSGRLIYAVKTTYEMLKEEKNEIEQYIKDAINKKTYYRTPRNVLDEYFSPWEKRVILHSSKFLTLDSYHWSSIIYKIQFFEKYMDWKNIETQINFYEEALKNDDSNNITHYSLVLNPLRGLNCILLSKNEYIKNVYLKYINCIIGDQLYRDSLR